jgi:N-acetyl-gamma-glutamyl-phosphate reductase
MKKIRVGIIGATGYTGMELLRLLLRHPQVEITLATSEKQAGKKVSDAFPFLIDETNLVLTEAQDEDIAKHCDLAFSCLPHGKAMTHVAAWRKAGLKVVDLSADFRLASEEDYKTWYGAHTETQLLKEAVYGLPELNREKIKKASLVANPGCYPTGAILALTPLLKENCIDPSSIIIDSKSGVSGAGRSAIVESLFSEVNDSVHAYKVGMHRHTGEIEQALSWAAGTKVTISFTPHLIPMDRGILTTIYADALSQKNTTGLLKILKDAYQGERFVKILSEGKLPKTKDVRGTNLCLIGGLYDPRTNRHVLIATIDNLLKGASSQAVQNMNLMSGFEESMGIAHLPLVP